MNAVKDSVFRKVTLFFLLPGALLLGLPLFGALVIGHPLGKYMEFPPRTPYVEHAPFSWIAFVLLAALILVVVLPFIIQVLRNQRKAVAPVFQSRPFPWWGWLGVVLCVAAWALAWNRFTNYQGFPLTIQVLTVKALTSCQIFTHTPIWLGYILVVNALTYWRTGHCMLIDRPRFFIILFPVSAGYWWFFEYLNRFVQNWHYTGIANLQPWQYFLYATFPFSTVLPGVMGTYELVSSFSRLSSGLDQFMPLRIPHPRVIAWTTLVISCLGLAAIGAWPDYLFPLLWVSPLFILTSLQTLHGERNIFSGIPQGDWRRICLLGLAVLICGLFWEMWNIRSVAKWVYSVPFVDRFHIFEMPLLGFAGYLPFGIECAVIADIIRGKNPGNEHQTKIDT